MILFNKVIWLQLVLILDLSKINKFIKIYYCKWWYS